MAQGFTKSKCDKESASKQTQSINRKKSGPVLTDKRARQGRLGDRRCGFLLKKSRNSEHKPQKKDADPRVRKKTRRREATFWKNNDHLSAVGARDFLAGLHPLFDPARLFETKMCILVSKSPQILAIKKADFLTVGLRKQETF